MLKLTIAPTPEEKWSLLYEASQKADQLLHKLYIPSHKRHDNVRVFEACPSLRALSTLVVYESEEKAYRRNFPDVDILTLPDNYLNVGRCIGKKRQFIMDIATDDEIIELDDDMLNARMVCAKYPGVTTVPPFSISTEDRVLGSLALFSAVSTQAYDRVPTAVSSTPQSSINFPKTFLPEAECRWRLNHNAAHFCLGFKMNRYREKVGYRLDVSRFGPGTNSEEKAYGIEILLAGCDIVEVPSILLTAAPMGDSASGKGVTTVPRSPELYERTAKALEGYPSDLFHAKTHNGVTNWSMTLGKLRRSGRSREERWSDL